MNTKLEQIVAALEQERDRVDEALRILSGLGGRGPRLGHRGPHYRERLSLAARRKISEAAKARWLEAKRAGRNSLK